MSQEQLRDALSVALGVVEWARDNGAEPENVGPVLAMMREALSATRARSWHWAPGWGTVTFDSYGRPSANYADLTLYDEIGVAVIPIEIDEGVLVLSPRITPENRALIEAAPRLLAAVEEASAMLDVISARYADIGADTRIITRRKELRDVARAARGEG